MSKEDNLGKIERIKEGSKAYALIVLTAAIFSGLMFVTSGIALYGFGQSIDPDVVSTVDNLSHQQFSTGGMQIISMGVVGFDAMLSVIAYYQLRKWFRMHNQNLAHVEKFKIKIWPVVGMGLVVALALSVLGALVSVTNTSLHGLDPTSIYHALKSGSIYGIFSVLYALPAAGIIIIYLGPKTYHYVEGLEEKYKIPDIPDPKKKDQPQ